jgi:hypothetical protein
MIDCRTSGWYGGEWRGAPGMRRSQVSALLVLTSLTAAALVAVLVGRDLASFLSVERLTAIEAPARMTVGIPRQPTPVGEGRWTHGEPATRAILKFDALQIGQDVPSVFAGRAPPSSHVTVLADQRPIARATANESGEWVVVVEEKFAAGDHKFSLTATVGQDGARIDSQTVQRTISASVR